MLSQNRPISGIEDQVFTSPTTYTGAYCGVKKLGGKKNVFLPPICNHWMDREFGSKRKYPDNRIKEFKERVRFDLMWKPKEIVRTSPHDMQKPFTCTKDKEDEQKELARRTRPRCVMTPAVSLDDIDDQVRDVVLADVYTSTSLRAAREVRPSSIAIKAPLPEKVAPAVPIFLPKLKSKMVSKEWRWDSIRWDERQMRGHCEPDKEFWTKVEK